MIKVDAGLVGVGIEYIVDRFSQRKKDRVVMVGSGVGVRGA